MPGCPPLPHQRDAWCPPGCPAPGDVADYLTERLRHYGYAIEVTPGNVQYVLSAGHPWPLNTIESLIRNTFDRWHDRPGAGAGAF